MTSQLAAVKTREMALLNQFTINHRCSSFLAFNTTCLDWIFYCQINQICRSEARVHMGEKSRWGGGGGGAAAAWVVPFDVAKPLPQLLSCMRCQVGFTLLPYSYDCTLL